MPKRLEDLDPQTRQTPAQGAAGLDQARRDAETYKDLISELLGDPNANFAATTLQDLWDTIDKSGVVTEGQKRAINNIHFAVLNPRGSSRGGSRRYEGWSRGSF